MYYFFLPPAKPYYPHYLPGHIQSTIEGVGIPIRIIDLNANFFTNLFNDRISSLKERPKFAEYSDERLRDTESVLAGQYLVYNQLTDGLFEFTEYGLKINFSSNTLADCEFFLCRAKKSFVYALLKEEIEKLNIIEPSPVILISVSYYEQYLFSLLVLEILKEQGCKANVLMGGGFISDNFSELTRTWSNCKDFLIEFLGLNIENPQVLSRIFTLSGEEPKNKRYPASKKDYVYSILLSDLPIRHEYVKEKSYLFGTHYLPMLTSSRCYYGKCVFCNTRRGEFARRTGEQLFNDMLCSYEETGTRLFRFIDDAIVPRTMLELSRLIFRNNAPFKWFGNFRVDVWLECEKNIQLLKRGGLVGGFIGVESFLDSELTAMCKGSNVKGILRVLSNFKSCEIPIIGSILIGFPYESQSTSNVTMLSEYMDLFEILEVNRFVLTTNSPLYFSRSNRILPFDRYRCIAQTTNVDNHLDQKFIEIIKIIRAYDKAPSFFKTNQFIKRLGERK